MDDTLATVASSLSKIVESRCNSEEMISFKFKEFHMELDNVLRQVPFIEGMQFCVEVIKQANELLDRQPDVQRICDM